MHMTQDGLGEGVDDLPSTDQEQPQSGGQGCRVGEGEGSGEPTLNIQ